MRLFGKRKSRLKEIGELKAALADLKETNSELIDINEELRENLRLTRQGSKPQEFVLVHRHEPRVKPGTIEFELRDWSGSRSYRLPGKKLYGGSSTETLFLSDLSHVLYDWYRAEDGLKGPVDIRANIYWEIPRNG